MMDAEEMRAKLNALRAINPGQFDRLAWEACDADRRDAYQAYVQCLQDGQQPNIVSKSSHAGRGAPLRAYPAVMEWVWVRVSFMVWRDNVSIVQACDALARRGVSVYVYDTADGKWDGVQPEPARILIEPAGGNLRNLFYRFAKLAPHERASAELLLQMLKDGHDGKPSGYTREAVDMIVPPRGL